MPGLRKNKVEILQCLREPETLHVIRLIGVDLSDVSDDRVSVFGAGDFLDVLEHAPGGVLEGLVACYAVHDEDGFDGLGSAQLLVSWSPGPKAGFWVCTLICTARQEHLSHQAGVYGP